MSEATKFRKPERASEADTVVQALWQGQSNERVRSLQAAFARALGQTAREPSVPRLEKEHEA